MLFNKQPKLTLQLAIYLTEQITDIAYSYKNDTSFIPQDIDLKRFDILVEKLWETHAVLQYITTSMHKRVEDKKAPSS